MFIYYKQKEIDDLKKVDSINATLAKAVEGVKEFIGRSFNRLNWCIILSGTMTFKEVLLMTYAQTHVSEKDIEENPNRGIYAYVCPKEIQEFGDMITKELGKIKFPTDVIIFTKCTTMPPTISLARPLRSPSRRRCMRNATSLLLERTMVCPISLF